MSWRPNNENSDSEDEAGEYFGRQGREAFIYLVDAFLYRDQDRLQKCLECIRDSMLNSILSRDKDLIGLVFCNTENSPEPKDKEGLENITIHKNNAMFLPLKQLSKSIVDYYLNFKDPDYFDFENRFGTAEGNFANTIWLCTNMLKHSGFKLQTSTIVFFTDRDTPHAPDSHEYQLAIQKASDLQQIDVNFTVIPMKDDFDYEPFYKEFICTVREIELDAFEIPNPEVEKTMIIDREIRQNFHKRCNNHLRLNIGEGLELAVGVYNYYKRNVFPKSVKLHRLQENSVIQMKYVNKIEVFDAETREVISERYALPGDQRKCITVGGSKIYFTSDEVMKLKSPVSPGINLLGFKPRSVLTITDYVKSCSFLYPDEKVIAGSTNLFRALWQKCIEKEKVAICTIVSRRKTAPRYVALIPTESNEDNVSSPMLNDGFRMVYLPFEIDYRKIDLSNRKAPELPAEGVELFQKILKKLKIKYSPGMFKDPGLKLLYLNIVGLAFDIQEDVYNEGCTLPDVEMQDSRIQSYVDELVGIFGTDLEIAAKRKGTNNTDQRSKVQKVTEEVPSREQIGTLLASNSLDQLTVKQLRNYLRNNNVGGISTATKPSLIEKVKELHT